MRVILLFLNVSQVSSHALWISLCSLTCSHILVLVNHGSPKVLPGPEKSASGFCEHEYSELTFLGLHIKYCNLDGSNNKHLFSHSFGDWGQVVDRFGFFLEFVDGSLFPVSHLVIPLCYLSYAPPLKGTLVLLEWSCQYDFILPVKALLPNTVTYSTYEFEGSNLTHNRWGLEILHHLRSWQFLTGALSTPP
jgi:hypothetical protein